MRYYFIGILLFTALLLTGCANTKTSADESIPQLIPDKPMYSEEEVSILISNKIFYLMYNDYQDIVIPKDSKDASYKGEHKWEFTCYATANKVVVEKIMQYNTCLAQRKIISKCKISFKVFYYEFANIMEVQSRNDECDTEKQHWERMAGYYGPLMD